MSSGTLTLRLFGGIMVLRDGTAVDLPQSRKTRALLAYLAATNTAQRRDRLCELFWDLPDDPKGSLRWSLSRLRPLVDDKQHVRLRADRQTAVLDLSDVDVDLQRVRVAARAAETLPIDELRRVGDLVEGAPLAALDLPECLGYQAWLIAERESARQAGKQVLRALVARLDRGSNEQLAYARNLAALAPEDEDAQAALIAALVSADRRTEAEQQAALAEAQLREAGRADTGAIRRALAGTATAGAAQLGTDKPSIAILPFANSGAEIDDYLVDGVVDAITDALACYTWLFVIARQSAFAFKSDADPRVAAKALGVRYLLTGSVLRGVDRVRIVCRLFDGETGAQVWLDRFDRDARDIFELQDEVSAAVASRLQPTIIAADSHRSRRKPTESLDAYDYYLRALPYIYLPQGRGQADAIALLEESLKRDPHFAVSMAMLANLRFQNRNYLTPAGVAESLRLARQAVQLGRDDARVLAIAGFIIGYGAHDFDNADQLIDRALAVNPNSYAALGSKAWAHIFWGDPTKAEELLDAAERMSPRDPFHYLLQTARAAALYQTDRFAEAEVQARAATLSNPAFDTSRQFLVASLVELGRVEEARAALSELRAIAPHQTLTFLKQAVPFRPKSRIDKFVAALALAGMPVG